MTILDLLRRRAAKDPVRVAVHFESRHFTFADLEGGSNAAARVLRSCGVERGDRVLLYAGTSIDYVLVVLGALKLGAIAVTANPGYREQELRWILADSEPRVIVADRDGLARCAELAASSTAALLEIERGEGPPPSGGPRRFPFYQALKKSSVHMVDEIITDSDPALLLYTSGTTGKAKGALLSHGNLAANALALHDAFGWTDQDRLLLTLPLFHVHGLCVGLLGSLAGGGELHLRERFDAARVIDELRAERCTLFFGVPTMYRRLLDLALADGSARSRLTSLRLFVSGSAPLPVDVKDAFERATGHRIAERYGMTETLITLAQRHDGAKPAGCVGGPVAGMEIRIVDSDLHDAKDGETGELLVRGASVGPEYWRNPEASQAARLDGWFATGDLACRDVASGEYRIVGRARDLILSGGLNVYPREVEDALESHHAVAEAAVIGVPDRDLGEAVAAIVVLRAGQTASEAELLEHCRARIASFKKPRLIRFAANLPKNAMGKVVRSELRLDH
jgi:malonyl-CoA/methylmalonyl-CoA synthetase